MIKKVLLLICLFISYASLSFAIRVYPNPWIPGGKTSDQGTLAGGITFDSLPSSGGEIDIYNETGELVRKLLWDSGVSVNWDGKNDNGEYVASGVYLWKVKDSDAKVSKLVIIR